MVEAADASTVNAVTNVFIALITIVPATLAAVWAKEAKKNSKEANHNSAGALHEVKANGGMSDPDPTLKDYIKFVGENVEQQGRQLAHLRAEFDSHVAHSRIMDSALSQVYVKLHPDLDKRDVENLIP